MMIADVFSSMVPWVVGGVPLAISLFEMVDQFEMDGKMPNPDDFAKELEAKGLPVHAQGVRAACRFDSKTILDMLKNAIYALREKGTLPRRETLPSATLAEIFTIDPDLVDVVRTPTPPQWSAYGIEGPTPGYSLDPETRLGWFVSFLIISRHGDNLKEAQKASGISYRRLVEIRDRKFPRSLQRMQGLRGKLIDWAKQGEASYGTLMAHLFDDFLALRLGWLGLTEETAWQKDFVRSARAHLFSNYGVWPPEELENRLAAIINIATGYVHWRRAQSHPLFAIAKKTVIPAKMGDPISKPV